MKRLICVVTLMSALIFGIHAQQEVFRLTDVVYDHKDGLAFVFDVIKPEKQNVAAILYILSGGWVSRAASTMNTESYEQFTDKGYTVFVISHCSQPRYNVSEIIEEVQRAIRFIRFNADKYGIDPDRLGIEGSSAGAHLSVSAAVFGKDAIPEQEYRRIHSVQADQKIDPVELVSSKVQVVACFYPPANLVSYDHPDSTFADFHNVAIFVDAFGITKDMSGDQVKEIFRQSSPYFFINQTTPPILIFQGTKDLLVPYSQAVNFIEKMKENNIPCQLITKQGAAHGWPYNKADDQEMIKWFETYLLKSKTD
jgi:acetyl esterase/lipase